MKQKAIVTMPPYASYMKEVIKHSIVEGIRLNTVMPIKGETIEDAIKRMQDACDGKDLWIDLKCRQLRIVSLGEPPYTALQLSHQLSVKTPVTAYFSDGRERGTIVAVEGNELVMQEGPRRVIGPGESVNIVDPSLSIKGYLTDTDKRYIDAGQKAGVSNYMLSYVEGCEDIRQFKTLYPGATTIAKIESLKGLSYVKNRWKGEARLMAARGDLFIEVVKPHKIIDALETIIQKDEDAIVASRIFSSFSAGLEPSCEDIGDVDSLLRMGYKTFMFGDDVCFRRESIISSLNLLAAMAERYESHAA